MLSLIIISKPINQAEQEAKRLCAEMHISPFDLAMLETENASLGIEDIRNWQKTLFLKPVKSKTKAVIINHAEKLTREAQNACLKILEEPPENTQIILLATTEQNFLPTILSRCKVTKMSSTPQPASPNQPTIDTFMEITNSSAGKKFTLAETYGKDKETARQFLEESIQLLHEELIKETHRSMLQPPALRLIKRFQAAHKTLQTTNISPRFILEQIFI